MQTCLASAFFIHMLWTGLLTVEIVEIRLLIVVIICSCIVLFLMRRCRLLYLGLCRGVGRRLGFTCSSGVVLFLDGS